MANGVKTDFISVFTICVSPKYYLKMYCLRESNKRLPLAIASNEKSCALIKSRFQFFVEDVAFESSDSVLVYGANKINKAYLVNKFKTTGIRAISPKRMENLESPKKTFNKWII